MSNDAPKSSSFIRSPGLKAAAALLLSFIAAYAADAILDNLRDQSSTSFELIRPVFFLAAVATLLLAAMTLALSWFVLVRLPPSRAVAIIFLVAGLFVVAQYFSLLVGFPLWLRDTPIGQLRNAMIDFGTRSLLYVLACFWTAIGVTGFVRRRSADPNPATDAS